MLRRETYLDNGKALWRDGTQVVGLDDGRSLTIVDQVAVRNGLSLTLEGRRRIDFSDIGGVK
jgi:hypothetical protein